MTSKKLKSKRPVVRRTSPTTCSVSLSPLVMRFAADCISEWAAMSRLSPVHRAHDSFEFAQFLANHVVSEMRKAHGTPNTALAYEI